MLEAEDSSDEELDANDDPKEDTPTTGEDIEDGYDEEESDEEVPTDQSELLKRIKQLKEVCTIYLYYRHPLEVLLSTVLVFGMVFKLNLGL